MKTTSRGTKTCNVLLVVRWPVGGIRTFIRYFYAGMDPGRFSFTIVAPEVPETGILLEDLKELNVRSVPLREQFTAIGFFRLIAKTIRTGKYDIVHSHGFTSGMLSAVPARLFKTKHIMTSHDILHKKNFTGMKGYLKKSVFSLLFRITDVIHCVSFDSRDNLMELFPGLKKNEAKCIVIRNAIEVSLFQSPGKRDFHAELNLPQDAFLIGFFGRFMSPKGFIYLVEAIEFLIQERGLPRKPMVLTFGAGGFMREDKKIIKEKGLEDYFTFLPFVSNIASSLKGLDVVAVPSIWETCPLLPMEAMVAGTPVIGSNCIGLREVLHDTPSVTFPARDSTALAEALAREIRNTSRPLAEAFRKEASARFNVKKQASKLEKLFVSMDQYPHGTVETDKLIDRRECL